VRTFVPEGLSERSPVSGDCRTGLAFLKSYPSRTGRSTNAGNRSAACKTKSLAFLSSLMGRTCFLLHFPAPKPSISIVPYGTDLFFASFPSPEVFRGWATFVRSLRD
jgi:hypothetical protein